MIHRGRGNFWMARRPAGYTIVEVMVVLGVTGALLTAAIGIFQGQQGKTLLSQSLYGLASKIQSYGSQVNSGVFDNSAYSCSVSQGRPKIVPHNNNPIQAQYQCLSLGRALQISPSQPTLTAYTVLGDSYVWNGSVVTNETSQSFDEANPTPATASSGTWPMTDTYNLPSGMTFVSSTFKDQSGAQYTPPSGTGSNLFGIYIDLGNTTNNTTALSTRGYALSNSATPASPYVTSCIEQTAASCSPTSYVKVRSWELCVKSGSLQGSVTVTTNASGLATSVDAEEC